MERLIGLVEKRNEIGQRQSYRAGGSRNDQIEFARLGELIIKEICQLHESGTLKKMIELPFEIGKKVYVIKKNSVVEDIVEDYDIWSLKDGIHLRIKVMNNDCYVIGAYNKDVFKTKEEAEEALRKKVE